MTVGRGRALLSSGCGMVPGRWIPPHSRMEPLGTLWGGGDSGVGTPFPQGKRYFQSCLKIIAGYVVTIKQPRVVFVFSEFGCFSWWEALWVGHCAGHPLCQCSHGTGRGLRSLVDLFCFEFGGDQAFNVL